MKIRHKQSGVELEGEFVETKEFFVEPAPHLEAMNSTYSKSIWEAVEPKWVDVGDKMLGIMHHLPDGLRLRKIKMLRAYAPPAGFSSPQYEPVDAFIIEQRQA